jgi:putative ABC transport system permease protein
MIKNYLKIALRGFWKHKLFTLINIIGLSIGISAALVIFLIVHFDFTFDKFHKDEGHIYRAVSNFSFQGEEGYNGGICGPMIGAVKSQVTGVEVSAPIFTLSQPNVFIPGKGNIPFKFKNLNDVVLANDDYFKIFNYKWLAGSAEHALTEPNQVVLTSEQAKIYFPALSYQQIIGKIVTYDTIKTTVTGIVQTQDQNTDFTFHDFISFNTGTVIAYAALADQLQLKEWQSTSSSLQLFLRLTPTASITSIEKQLDAILKKNSPPRPRDKGNTHAFKLQQLNDLHFNANYGLFDFSTRGPANKTTLYCLLSIAAFLLLLGCINFINLTTAQ